MIKTKTKEPPETEKTTLEERVKNENTLTRIYKKIHRIKKSQEDEIYIFGIKIDGKKYTVIISANLKSEFYEDYRTEESGTEFFYEGTLKIIEGNEENKKTYNFKTEKIVKKTSLEDYIKNILNSKSTEELSRNILKLYNSNQANLCFGKAEREKTIIVYYNQT